MLLSKCIERRPNVKLLFCSRPDCKSIKINYVTDRLASNRDGALEDSNPTQHRQSQPQFAGGRVTSAAAVGVSSVPPCMRHGELCALPRSSVASLCGAHCGGGPWRREQRAPGSSRHAWATSTAARARSAVLRHAAPPLRWRIARAACRSLAHTTVALQDTAPALLAAMTSH